MNDRCWKYAAAVWLVMAVALALVWAMPCEACTPAPEAGKHCPEELPPQYKRICALGCFIVRPQALREYKAAEAKALEIPRLRLNNERLLLAATEVQTQRDRETDRANLAAAQLAASIQARLQCQQRLADAPSWSTVVVGVVAGIVVGSAAGGVLVLIL